MAIRNPYKLHILFAILIATVIPVFSVATWLGKIFAIIIWAIGFIITGIGTFHKSARVGEMWNWKMAAHPTDKFEKFCWLYGSVIFVWGFGLSIVASMNKAI